MEHSLLIVKKNYTWKEEDRKSVLLIFAIKWFLLYRYFGRHETSLTVPSPATHTDLYFFSFAASSDSEMTAE